MPLKKVALAATVREASGAWVSERVAVVFLHGVGCNRTQFVRQFEGLDSDLELISIDLPGHGQSSESADGRYDLVSMTSAVGAELRSRGLTNALLIGHSAGGFIALELAASFSGLAAGVVVLDTNTALSETSIQHNRERAEKAENGNWRRHFLTSMESAWGPADGPAADSRAAVFQSLAETPERVVRPFWRDALTVRAEPLWRKCPIPSLYIRSKRKTDLRRLEALNPLISTVDVGGRGLGHWIQLQCPEVVNQAITDFAASVRVGSRKARDD